MPENWGVRFVLFTGILVGLSHSSQTGRHGVPVVTIQHALPQPDAPVFRKGSKEWALHPEVAARPHDVLIHKSLPGSFTGTELGRRCNNA
jgi:nicotinamidase-related amidase